MKVARVTGSVVATIKSPIFEARKLLICDLLDAQGALTGAYSLAVDSVGAGPGETVLILDEGNSARQVVARDDAPIRAVVVGIVDEIETASDA